MSHHCRSRPQSHDIAADAGRSLLSPHDHPIPSPPIARNGSSFLRLPQKKTMAVPPKRSNNEILLVDMDAEDDDVFSVAASPCNTSNSPAPANAERLSQTWRKEVAIEREMKEEIQQLPLVVTDNSPRGLVAGSKPEAAGREHDEQERRAARAEDSVDRCLEWFRELFSKIGKHGRVTLKDFKSATRDYDVRFACINLFSQ